MESLRHSPLQAEHVALGAKLVPFGGWNMPVAYPTGTLHEHRACRTGAVAFDVSHLGTVRVEGSDAFERLQRAFTNDLHKIAPGRAQYTHLLDDKASVLDDIIVWWIDTDTFDVMPNASNTDSVRAAVGGTDITGTRAIIAVQGPKARDLLATVAPGAAAIGRFRVGSFEWNGVTCGVAGTGYTGEDGVECAVPVALAPEFWRALLAAGIEPAGLGARDTLRLEAGLPLHGHELGVGITSLQASLGWVVAWDKPGGFVGLEALVAERDAGPARVLRGIRTESRRPPRDGSTVVHDGVDVGVVTSGNFSPILECGIALAFVDPSLAVDTKVIVRVRDTHLDGVVVKPPFISVQKGK